MQSVEWERNARSHRQSQFVRRVIIAGWIGACLGSAGMTAQSHAQGSNSQLLPAYREELADEERQTWSLKKFPSQPYMSEFYWRFSSDTPAFFRESMLQFVARSYYLTRDNFDGSRSQAWAGGGWIAYRSGLIADHFGIHGALYTSQPLFAPSDEAGTRLLNPQQEQLSMLGQAYGFAQFGDQELRGGRTLIDTPLINPQDNRMVPNTFESVMATTLPNKSREYDYSVGYIWTIKQRDSNDFIPLSDAIAGADVLNRGAPYAMVKYRPPPIPG